MKLTDEDRAELKRLGITEEQFKASVSIRKGTIITPFVCSHRFSDGVCDYCGILAMEAGNY